MTIHIITSLRVLGMYLKGRIVYSEEFMLDGLRLQSKRARNTRVTYTATTPLVSQNSDGLRLKMIDDEKWKLGAQEEQ